MDSDLLFPLTRWQLDVYFVILVNRSFLIILKNFKTKMKKILTFGPNGAVVESACQCRRHERRGSIPRSGRFPGVVGNGNPFQYFCLENSMDRGAWRSYSPWVPRESDTTEHAHACAHTHTLTHKLLDIVLH